MGRIKPVQPKSGLLYRRVRSGDVEALRKEGAV
jgi:hypothetical protein